MLPLSLRVEVSDGEVSRAAQAALRGHDPFAAGARFDEVHLRGRVLFDIGVDLDADPVLTFLKERRGMRLAPPLTAAVEQPVAGVIGQLAGAAVLALHGEGEYTLPLRGSAGMITVGAEGDALVLGVPLESYAGVVRVPKADGARAIAAGCRDVAKLLRGQEALRPWPILSFLDREASILEALGGRAAGPSPPITDALRWPAEAFAHRGGPTLASLAARAEAAGAHVVPYWRAAAGAAPATVNFEPMRPASTAVPRGALARYILPSGEAALEAEVAGDSQGTARLRARLARPAPFTAQFGTSGLARLLEPNGALPMA